jgi:hypothetical protein
MAASAAQAALVGHWAFEEASSGPASTVLDSSGNGHNGTANGTVNYITGTNGIGAANFDGSTGYVKVNGSAGTALDMSGSNYTIAMWVKVNATISSSAVLVGNDDGADYANGVLFYAGNTGFLYASQIKAGGTGYADTQTWSTGFDLNNGWTYQSVLHGGVGNWVHLAITYDDATNTRNFYVDGLNYNVNTTTTANAGSDGTTDLYFGRYTVNNSAYLNGALDDIRIYDETLTGAQIAEVMTAAVPEPTSAILLVAGLSGMAMRRRRV